MGLGMFYFLNHYGRLVEIKIRRGVGYSSFEEVMSRSSVLHFVRGRQWFRTIDGVS